MADQAPPVQEEEMDEELEDLPEPQKQADPLRNAKIQRMVEGKTFVGQVEEIEQGKLTKDRLYRIKYEDGDLEHLTAEQVKEMMVEEEEEPEDEEEDEEQEAPSSKKPAASAKSAAKAKAAAAKEKAKAKAKAAPKTKAKAAPKAKAKAKAVAKTVAKKPAKK
eukprot:TRINITY_DN32503_c0_g1_i1.p2 TRINITY_DN32503_c0_g1~~TRINITY_DN32503_c0_g1_i1.p2  ORF type:complete len:163 (+),score=74.44 TRINITY_DN32503_c0_g1_i1:71-559(+)